MSHRIFEYRYGTLQTKIFLIAVNHSPFTIHHSPFTMEGERPSTPSSVVVLLLCGLPASGKSSLAKQVREQVVTQQQQQQQAQAQAQSQESSSSNHDDDDDDDDDDDCYHRFFRRTGCCHLIEYDALQESLTDNDDDETNVLEAWRQTRGVALQDFQKVLTECVGGDVAVERFEMQTQTQTETEQSILSSLVILDDNFHLPSMRKQVYQTCQKVVAASRYEHGSSGGNNSNSNNSSSVGIYFGIVYVDTAVALCLERNRQRQRAQAVVGVVPDEVIIKMQVTLQPPPAPNAFWEQATGAVLHIDGNGNRSQSRHENESEHHNDEHNDNDNETTEQHADNVQRVLKFAATLCQQPECRVPPPVDPAVEEERLAAERKRTAASVAHSTDQSLRQLVSVVAQIRPAAAAHANSIRQACLQRAKKDLATTKWNHHHHHRGDDDDEHSAGAGETTSVSVVGVVGVVVVNAASASFIEQVLQWPDWTDDERLDVKRQAAVVVEQRSAAQRCLVPRVVRSGRPRPRPVDEPDQIGTGGKQ
jgi:tRNA uridine 5-carbamoylmethylation protein Kti12